MAKQYNDTEYNTKPSNELQRACRGTHHLIVEASVLVLAEQLQAHHGQGIRLQQPQALLEGVVYVDLAPAADDGNAARPVCHTRSVSL